LVDGTLTGPEIIAECILFHRIFIKQETDMEEEEKEIKIREKFIKLAKDFRNISLTTTFIYTFIFVVLLWGICIAYVILQPSFSSIDIFHRIAVMVIILIIITIFSIFPTLTYLVFDKWGMYRATEKTKSELRHENINISHLSDEIEDESKKIYSRVSYPIPVLLATYSMIIGWVLFFFSEGPSYLYGLMRSGAVSYIFDNFGNTHPVVFGFLGAFFWALGTLFHRYIRGDLKAAVFINVTVRIWTVIVLTLVLTTVWTGYDQFWKLFGDKSEAPKALLAVCFMVGIFPEIGLELIKKSFKGIISVSSRNEISLSKIQGLTIWDQGRLAEEGIDNVQNLATCDVVGLIVNTRLGVMSLLNWVDQAILILHANKTYPDLQIADITTASDLEAIYAGRLDEDTCQILDNERQNSKRKTYLGCQGITRLPDPAQGLLEVLPKKADFNLKERVHNIMIAICDDINYQRLWHIRHDVNERKN
jgi:hypothetical protein